MDKNKVTFGLEGVAYALFKDGGAQGMPAWDEPKKIEGAVSFSPQAQGNESTAHADNRPYYIITVNDGDKGDLEMFMFPDEFLIDVLGYRKDKNGVLLIPSDAMPTPFALMFEVSGNVEAIRVVYYNVTGGSVNEAYTTTAGNVQVQSKKMGITAIPMDLGNGLKLIKAVIRRSDSPEAFDKFYDKVYVPEFTAQTPARQSQPLTQTNTK